MIYRILKILCIAAWFICTNMSAFAEPVETKEDVLFQGVKTNNMNLVQIALWNGADVNCISRGETPLLIAIDTENSNMVNYLLKQGADPNKTVSVLGYKTIVPINNAVCKASFNKNSNKIVKYLVEAGANVNLVDNKGNSPLIYAVSNPPNIKLIEYLLSQNANVNHRNTYNTTPLMIAAKFDIWDIGYKHQKITVAQILLNHGADPAMSNAEGKTALQIARNGNFNEMVKLLLPVTPKME